MDQRIGGIIHVQLDGETVLAAGSWNYNLGAPKREAVVGQDSVHGFTEMPQVAWCEGEITDQQSLDVKALLGRKDLTVTLELANGKMIMFRSAWYAGDGNIGTKEGNIAARFEARSAQEV